MPTDATGTPTANVSIPKYNTSADAPSGLGFNSAMDSIDALLSGGASLGTLKWGSTPGGTTTDTTLYRSAAGVLKTDGQLEVATNIVMRATDGSTGKLYFGATADTNLYRAGAGQLKTDGAFYTKMGATGGQPLATDWGNGNLGFYVTHQASGYARLDLTSTGGVTQIFLDGSGGKLGLGISLSNTNLVQAGKKFPIYDQTGALQGYVQIYTG